MGLMYKKYYDISKLVIWADPEANDQTSNRRPRLVFGFRDGNPRISVYTGANGADSVISFPMDVPTVVTIAHFIKDMAKADHGSKVAVESLTTLYENNQPTTNKKLVSTLYIGKSKEGLVYLSVITEGKPKLVFTIKTSPFHKFMDSNKADISDNIISPIMANGIADLILNAVTNGMFKYTDEEYTEGSRKQAGILSNTANNTQQQDTVKDEILQSLDDLGL